MYIYEKTKKGIQTYKMHLNKDRHEEFVDNFIFNGYLDATQYFDIITNDSEKPLEKLDSIHLSDINYKIENNNFTKYHVVKLLDDNEEGELEKTNLFASYFSGCYKNKKCILLINSSEAPVGCLIITNNYEEILENFYIMSSVIKFPLVMYYYHKIKQGDFSCLDDNKYIDIILSLYDISKKPVEFISYKDLERKLKMQIKPETVEEYLSKVENTEKVLKRIRK